jgi:hypothetical protein
MVFFVLFSCVRFQGTTKEVFVANAIQLALVHFQLFTHHHASKAIKVVAKYCNNMGIPFSLGFSTLNPTFLYESTCFYFDL